MRTLKFGLAFVLLSLVCRPLKAWCYWVLQDIATITDCSDPGSCRTTVYYYWDLNCDGVGDGGGGGGDGGGGGGGGGGDYPTCPESVTVSANSIDGTPGGSGAYVRGHVSVFPDADVTTQLVGPGVSASSSGSDFELYFDLTSIPPGYQNYNVVATTSKAGCTAITSNAAVVIGRLPSYAPSSGPATDAALYLVPVHPDTPPILANVSVSASETFDTFGSSPGSSSYPLPSALTSRSYAGLVTVPGQYTKIFAAQMQHSFSGCFGGASDNMDLVFPTSDEYSRGFSLQSAYSCSSRGPAVSSVSGLWFEGDGGIVTPFPLFGQASVTVDLRDYWSGY